MSHSSPVAAGTPAVAHPPGFVARRRVNWIFLGLMYGFFYMSRYNLAAIQTAMKELYGWSNADYGKIVSAATFVYGSAVLVNGPIADRFGGKRAILIGSAGAAFFNFLFGACFLFLQHGAVYAGGRLVSPAVFQHGMTATTMIATFAVLWSLNHYFQSFGALSIVKINAAWFNVRERGSFAGIFGIMIQSGRFFAFSFSPLILAFLPWQYCFWIPSAILVVMFFVNLKVVENTPADAGFEFDTGDETPDEAAKRPTLGFILRKVFASRAAWLIALASICIGMTRNSIDHWWAGYFSTVFSIKAADLKNHAAYNLVAAGTPFMAVAGGLVAGNLSDKVFDARRAPVIFFAFVGQAIVLVLLSTAYRSMWLGAVLLLAISFFIQAAHSLVGGAASMDFGGKKAVATAAGLFDGAQYLAASVVGYGLGTLLDHAKVPGVAGAEFARWPLFPLPFALVGCVLMTMLWNARPGRK